VETRPLQHHTRPYGSHPSQGNLLQRLDEPIRQLGHTEAADSRGKLVPRSKIITRPCKIRRELALRASITGAFQVPTRTSPQGFHHRGFPSCDRTAGVRSDAPHRRTASDGNSHSSYNHMGTENPQSCCKITSVLSATSWLW